ncbi:hypothetical protein ACO0QE_001703 [Hanseniaspora vineae]
MARNFYTEIDEKTIFPPSQGNVEHKTYIPSSFPSDNSESIQLESNNNGNGFLSQIFGTNQLVDGISIRNLTPITDFFTALRSSLNKTYNDKIETPLEQKSETYYKYESHLMQNYVDPLYTDKTEILLPGLAYTAIAYMTGAIMSRNLRPGILKLPLPLLLSALTFKYTLPSTFENTKNVLYKIESNFTTDKFLSKQHDLVQSAENLEKDTVESYKKSVEKVEELNNSVSTNWEKLKKFTGLNV